MRPVVSSQVSEAEAALQEREEQLAQREEEMRSILATNGQFEAEKAQREAQLAQMERQHLLNEESLAELGTKNADLAKEQAQMMARVAEAEEQALAMNSEALAIVEQNQMLQDERRKLAEEAEALRRMAADRSSETKELATAHGTLEVEMKKHVEVTAELRRVGQDNDGVKQSVQDIIYDIEQEARAEIQVLNAEVSRLVAQGAEDREEVQRLRTDNQQLQARVRELESMAVGGGASPGMFGTGTTAATARHTGSEGGAKASAGGRSWICGSCTFVNSLATRPSSAGCEMCGAMPLLSAASGGASRPGSSWGPSGNDSGSTIPGLPKIGR